MASTPRILAAIFLVLPKGGFHEICCCKYLICHGFRTRFHDDRFRNSNNIKVITSNPADLIEEGGEVLLSEIHRLINSLWSKEELLEQWTESLILPVHKNGDKTDCNNYRGISLLSIPHKKYLISNT
jgi:hypothetical protein